MITLTYNEKPTYKNRNVLFIITVITIVIAIILSLVYFVVSYKKSSVPVIFLLGDNEVVVTALSKYKDPGAIAFSGVDESIDVSVVSSNVDTKVPGSYTVSYKAMTRTGQPDVEATRTVIVVDQKPPVITLKGDKKITVRVNSSYEDPGVNAEDDVDGNITKDVQIKSNVNTNRVGTYKVTYKVSDKSDNQSTATRTVVVTPAPEPTPEVPSGRVTKSQKTVYLTFDDGPNYQITPRVLEVLKKHNVKATFFVVGMYVDANPKMAKRIVDEGHTIALHSYSHNYGKIYQSEGAFLADMERCRKAVKRATGVDTKLMRFPGGTSNGISKKTNPGIMTRLSKFMTKNGYRYYDWNMANNDANGASYSPSQMSGFLTNGLGTNSKTLIALLHDATAKKNTPQSVDIFLKNALANGYKFDKITESTPIIAHRPNN